MRTALSTANLYNVVIAAAGGKKFRQVREFMVDYEEMSKGEGKGSGRGNRVGGRGESTESLSPDRWKSIKADLKKVISSSRRIE